MAFRFGKYSIIAYLAEKKIIDSSRPADRKKTGLSMGAEGASNSMTRR